MRRDVKGERATKEREAVSLTVDISLAQVALISAETAGLVRRLFPNDPIMEDLATRIDRFLSVRADTLESRMYAGEVLGAWQNLIDTPEHRELLLAHSRLRGAAKQDYVAQRLRQLDTALKAEARSRVPARRAVRRRHSAA